MDYKLQKVRPRKSWWDAVVKDLKKTTIGETVRKVDKNGDELYENPEFTKD